MLFPELVEGVSLRGVLDEEISFSTLFSKEGKGDLYFLLILFSEPAYPAKASATAGVCRSIKAQLIDKHTKL